MRPVFHGNKIELPPGWTTPRAIQGLQHMLSTYKSGDLVLEETWHSRGVDPNEGGLTKNELQAILLTSWTLQRRLHLPSTAARMGRGNTPR